MSRRTPNPRHQSPVNPSGDRVAFERDPTIMQRYAKVTRSSNAGPFLAPPSKLKIRLRNLTFSNKLMLGMMMRMTDDFATNIALPPFPL